LNGLGSPEIFRTLSPKKIKLWLRKFLAM